MKKLSNNESKQKEYFDSLAQRRSQEVNPDSKVKNFYIEIDVYKKVIGLPICKKIIEIGCGDGDGGAFTEYFVSKGLDVTFLDISEESVNRLAEKLNKLGYEGYRPLSGLFKDIVPKIHGENFDIVFFGDTLHHLTQDETVELLQEITPFMHKNTKIVAFEPNGLWPFWRIMPKINKDFIWEVEKNITHCTKRGFRRKFRSAGLILEKYEYYRIVPLFLTDRSTIFRSVNKVLVRIPLLNLLSSYTIVVAGFNK